MESIEYYLKQYLQEKPLFLALIRAKEAELFQKYLPLKSPVLDVGCGDGFFAKVTFIDKSHPERPRYDRGSRRIPSEIRITKGIFRSAQNDIRGIIDVGLDLKESRVEEARKLGIYKKIVIYDGQKMPFPDNSFATIVSNCVLEHIPDLERTLAEIYRVLKPGGLFLTTVVASPWEEYFFGNKILGNFYKRWMRKKQVHHHMNSLHQWKNLFFNAGFKVKEDIGYLDRKAVEMIDILHYFSLPQLVTYKLWGNWVVWKGITGILPLKYFDSLISPDIPSDRSGNIFFVLKK